MAARRRPRPTVRARGGGTPAAFSHPEAARLRYVTDAEPGIARLRCRGGFRYVRAEDGTAVRDGDTLQRIRALAIPPAYEQVWICADPFGHLQATGRDARGRKQYRYHADWRRQRDADKFARMAEFGRALPRIRAGIARHLRLPGLSRRRVLATVVQLLEHTLVRVGNEEYARDNGSFGLTTLREDHVRMRPQAVRLRFRGKSGVEHDVTVSDPQVVRVIRRCLQLPGQDLFRWVDERGEARPVGSAEVNLYLRELARGDFTAKDFRTWSASVMALEVLASRPWTSRTQARREVVAAVKEVAARLGNTPSVCRNSYIHPRVIEAFVEAGPQALAGEAAHVESALQPAERGLLALVECGPRRSRTAVRRPAANERARAVRRGTRVAHRGTSIASVKVDRRLPARQYHDIDTRNLP